jgi:hypothetical protein
MWWLRSVGPAAAQSGDGLPTYLAGDGISVFPINSLVLILMRNLRAFMVQCPIALLSIALVAWRLPDCTQQGQQGEEVKRQSLKERLARVDMLGSVLLPSTLTALFIALDMAGKSHVWSHTASVAVVTLALGAGFIWVERSHATEPIFPPGLVLKRDVLTANTLVALQMGAQFIVSEKKL